MFTEFRPDLDPDVLAENLTRVLQSRDERAFQIVMSHVADIILDITKTYRVRGYQRDDLCNECLMVLRYEVIPTYDRLRGRSFRSFAAFVMRRRIFTLIKASYQQRRLGLNSAKSLYSRVFQQESELYGDYLNADWRDYDEHLLIDEVPNCRAQTAQQQMEKAEAFSRPYEWLRSQLTECETQVFEDRVSGSSYAETKRRMGYGQKKIDNARSRILQKALVWPDSERLLPPKKKRFLIKENEHAELGR